MVEILPNIYLSRYPPTIPKEITHVLNLGTIPHIPSSPPPTHLHIPLREPDDIRPHIPAILAFIDNAVASPENKVLLHCALGINRSASAMVAYICYAKSLKASEALEFLRERKDDVNPMTVFLAQINEFFGREELIEDPLVRFHQRLKERKMGGRQASNEERVGAE